MAASANPILAEKGQRDPTLVCTGYKRSRFYMFTRSEPEHKSGDRDIFNERPTREEQSIATSTTGAKSGPSPIANSATIHTTMGDIHLRLFPQQAPKAVENFVGHARSGYFENLIFHRVIPKFMIQTGDPLGDGTGGTSIWGDEFEDEFSDDLKHDRWAFSLKCKSQGLTLFQAVYCQYGQRRAKYQRIAILHHDKRNTMAGPKTYHFWPRYLRLGGRAQHRKRQDEQGRQAVRGYQDCQRRCGIIGICYTTIYFAQNTI